MKKNTPGCATVDCCATRPCCSTIWDFVRSDFATVTATLSGTNGGYAPSDPMVAVSNFVESVGSPPFVFYQCSIGAVNEEPYETHSPPPLPYRTWATQGVGVDPDTGIAQKYYAEGGLTIEVLACLPSPQLKVTAFIVYGWMPDGSPVSDLTTAGYSLDSGFFSTSGESRYYKTVGDFLHEVFVAPGPGYKCRIYVTYSKTLTNVADILTAIPNPLTLTPAYNPHPMSLVVSFS